GIAARPGIAIDFSRVHRSLPTNRWRMTPPNGRSNSEQYSALRRLLSASRPEATAAGPGETSERDHHLADLLVRLQEFVRRTDLLEAVELARDHRLQTSARQPGEDLLLRELVTVREIPDLARHPATHRQAFE